MQAKFCCKFNYYLQKSYSYRWEYKFQATGSVNDFNNKAENSRSDRKLTISCADNVDAVRDSFRRESEKSPHPRRSRWSFTLIIAKNLKEGYIAVPKEAGRQLHKNVESNIEQVLAATPHKAPTMRPPVSHYENYPS